MESVGSANRVDGVDLQLMVNAAGTFARPQPGATHSTADAQSDARISSAGKLRGATAAVLDAAAQLNKSQTWQATKASSDNETLVHAVSDKAKPGDYAIDVQSMATSQSTASAAFSSLSTVVGIGTLNLEMGSWNPSTSTFATNPNWPKASVTFGPKDTSLERIRDKINAAGVGVIALVVSDATGSRLVLRSTSTGEANGFKTDAQAPEGQTHDQGSEAAQTLASMGFNPASVSGGAELTQPARDAKLSIDGRAVQSPQNLIEDEASGLTLRLNGDSGKATVRVETDTQAMVHDVGAFVHAYNDMVGQLAQTAPDAQQDSATQAARAIQQRMQQAFGEGASGNQAPLSRKLASAGIEMQSDGRLSLNEAALGQALARNPQRVEQLFDAEAGGGQSSGLTARLRDMSASRPDAAQQPLRLSSNDAASPGHAGSMTATLYRQRMLEQQYAAATMHEDEPAMSANEA